MTTTPLRLRAGDLIEVRSRDEILATLDESGCLDGMPFMPEMLKFCGKSMRVARVAHKTCDTKCKTGGRSIKDCVHLANSRCDGTGHDGCQARCNLFWKTAWLRTAGSLSRPDGNAIRERFTETDLVRATHADGPDGRRFTCQATQILEATSPLPWWDPRQYVRDVTSGNHSAGTVLKLLVLSWFSAWRRYGYPFRLSHWVYDKVHRLLIGQETPYLLVAPRKDTQVSASRPILEVGDLVRIKSQREIRETLNATGRHRGLWFDAEMAAFCGGEFRVSQRVDKIINEQTGEMIYMKQPCIMLDGVECRARYSERRMFCPRAIPPYWRDIWLEPIEPHVASDQSEACNAKSA